jgi:PIN like domain
MNEPTEKLKKQSDGSPGQSQPDPFVLFLDESIHNCKPIHASLESLSVKYVRHRSVFSSGVLDTEWLPVVGEKKWAVLTSDKRIRFNELERAKIIEHGIRQFVFTSGNLSGATMGQILTLAIPRILKLVATYPAPFIALIS